MLNTDEEHSLFLPTGSLNQTWFNESRLSGENYAVSSHPAKWILEHRYRADVLILDHVILSDSVVLF